MTSVIVLLCSLRDIGGRVTMARCVTSEVEFIWARCVTSVVELLGSLCDIGGRVTRLV